MDKIVNTLQWSFSRVAMVYLVILAFCLTCVDFNMVKERIKVRRLNDSIPDFSDMIVFSRQLQPSGAMDWKPYKDYFELIYRYLPKDPLIKQFLGYVDYYTGKQEESVFFFRDSSMVNGKFLFWSNYDLGVIYYKQGLWVQADDYLFKAIASSPNLTLYVMNNSILYKQIFISPFFKYSVVDELEDARQQAYILLLSSLSHTGNYDRMAVIANLALADRDMPEKGAFYYYEGLAFLGMGQYQQAFLLLQKSSMLDKDDPYVYYYLASICQKTGQLDRVRSLLRISYLLHQKNDPRFPYDARTELRFF